MRLVLDTNVALSALVWRGTPYRLLSEIRRQSEAIQLFSSEALLTLGEYQGIPILTAAQAIAKIADAE